MENRSQNQNQPADPSSNRRWVKFRPRRFPGLTVWVKPEPRGNYGRTCKCTTVLQIHEASVGHAVAMHPELGSRAAMGAAYTCRCLGEVIR